MTDKLKKVGRLAFRELDGLWKAYYAMPDTMDGAIFLGSVAMRFVTGPDAEVRKAAFMALMKEAVADLIEETVGVRPSWPDGPRAAPFWEKGRRP